MRERPLSRLLAVVMGVACAVGIIPSGAFGAAPLPKPSPVAAVIQVNVISASRASAIVHQLYPHVRVRVDTHANAIVVLGNPNDVDSIRSVVQGIDVKNPTTPTTEIVSLQVAKPQVVIDRIAPLFPRATMRVASKNSILLRAIPEDATQIKSLISSLDATPPSVAPATAAPVETVRVERAVPRALARAVAHEVRDAHIDVSGSSLLISGDPSAVAQAKALAARLDVPPFGSRYTDIYRPKSVDAASVADLIKRTYPDVTVTVDTDLNAISVYATAAQHERIAAAIAQLDGAAVQGAGGAGASGGTAYGAGNVEVVHLQAAIPGQNSAPSTTAQDIATAVTQALGQMAPSLHVTVPANSDEIILAGDPESIRLAKNLIKQLDVTPPQVVLDTEVLEIDENDAKNVGIEMPNAVLSTTYSEIQPTPDPSGLPGRIGRLQPLTRTALSLTAQLNLLIQKGHGRVLADPRIATLSGHTATIRAGDTLAILTTTGGGVGTPVTQQIQTFNTGVTLDITPEVSAENNVIVSLHPVVNSLEGISSSGVPQIATRDTQTTVSLHNNQTLVIGGLIQEADQQSASVIPILGQLPLIGGLFRDNNVNITRNELVIVVTPHILKPGQSAPPPDATMGLPTAAPLPTLPPDAMLATMRPTPLPSTPLPAPVLYTPRPFTTPLPEPTPSAFAASNAFEYGTAPQNNYAGPQDSPQIFYARLQPTVFTPGAPMTLDTVTTTNVTRVTIGTLGRAVAARAVSPGKWALTFSSSQLSLSSAQQTTFLTLSAFRADGVAASIQIPVNPLHH